MEILLSSLEQQKNWKEFIKKSCRKNKINIQIAAFFTPIKIRFLYDRLLKIYEEKSIPESICWVQNQLKAFHWLLAIISGLKDRLIQNFDKDQWKQLGQIFLNKDPSTIKYESIKLVNEKNTKNRNWNQKQTQLLTEIIQESQFSNKWNEIARKLYQKSDNLFFRSGKQCRQRWLNHLDPNKKKGQWNEEQDKIIVKHIMNHGRKWSNIAKQLGSHRTQHMVKNRFKTLIIKQKKLTPQISHQTSLLKQIGFHLFEKSGVPIEFQGKIMQDGAIQMNQQNSLSLDQELQGDLFRQRQNKPLRGTDVINSQRSEEKLTRKKESQKEQMKKSFEKFDQKNLNDDKDFRPFGGEDYSKGFGLVSTPLSNFELQQIYSPYYLNYQGATPYLSPSSSVPFFVNTPINGTLTPSFSAFDNSFNQNLFICPSYTNNQAENLNFPQ